MQSLLMAMKPSFNTSSWSNIGAMNHPKCCTQSGNAMTNKGLQTHQWIFSNYLFHFWGVLPFTLAVKNRPEHRPRTWQLGAPTASLTTSRGSAPGPRALRSNLREEWDFHPGKRTISPRCWKWVHTAPNPQHILYDCVWIWVFEIFAGYLKPSLSCWDSVN